MPPKSAVKEEKLEEIFDRRADKDNPFWTTGDVARELDVSTETARKYLHRFDEYVSYGAGRGQIWFRKGDKVEINSTGSARLRAGQVGDRLMAKVLMIVLGSALLYTSSGIVSGISNQSVIFTILFFTALIGILIGYFVFAITTKYSIGRKVSAGLSKWRVKA